MTVIGNPRSFHKKFKFIVEIDAAESAGLPESEAARWRDVATALHARLETMEAA